jgi:hypothetical protein
VPAGGCPDRPNIPPLTELSRGFPEDGEKDFVGTEEDDQAPQRLLTVSPL